MSQQTAGRPFRPVRHRLAAGGLALGRLLRAAAALVALVALIGGLPWGLWHFIGWPLPHHLPSWAEISARLTGPMDDSLLLDILSVLLWPLWFTFAISVVLAVPDVLREARRPTFGPSRPSGGMRGFATFLLGAVILTALHTRAPLTPSSGPIAATAVSTAPAAPHVVPVAAITSMDTTLPAAGPGTVVVQLPHGGVYDSLWRIAQRCLGDGARWPELWTLNRGVVQADGRALDHPTLIRPGWVLRLPPETTAPAPPAHPPVSSPPTSAPSSTTVPASPPVAPPSATNASPRESGGPSAAGSPTMVPTPTAPSTAPSAPPSPAVAPTHGPAIAPSPPRSPGVQVPSGGYLGLGAVALLVAALFTVRLWRRRHYLPGSGRRDDLDEPPVIRQLALAYDAATAIPDEYGDPVVMRPPGDVHVAGRRHAQATAAEEAGPPGTQVIGTTRDGRPLALDLAATRGLGLIGPGADAAIRALLLAALGERHRPDSDPVEVLIPAADARRILGEEAAADPPQRLHVVADLASLLDRLEAEVITRARLASTEGSERPALVVIAAPDQALDRRLQAVLDNGSPLGLVGILYGQWRPGATARARSDGVVGAASPDIAAALTGARLFTLPPADTAQLLGLLRDADAPADNQEAYRRANPTQGPPPPSPASAPPLGSNADIPPAEADTRERNAFGESPEPVPAPTWAAASMPADSSAQTAPPAPPGRSTGAVQPPAATTPLLLTLFGSLRLRYRPTPDSDYQLVDGLGPKTREVLAYLALHPDGTRREAITAALWPDDVDTQRRLDNRVYAALSRLRGAIRAATTDAITDIVGQEEDRYRLRRDLVTVDLWNVYDALDQRRRAATAAERLAAILPITTTYTGHLSDDLVGAWAEPYRENLRRQVTDALASLTASIGENDPQRLDLLEMRRRLDPYNEDLYRQIAHAQTHLGRHDAVGHTYALLLAALDEIDQRPSPETVAFFRALHQPGPHNARSA